MRLLVAAAFVITCSASVLDTALDRHLKGLDMECRYPGAHSWWASLTPDTVTKLSGRNFDFVTAAKECLYAEHVTDAKHAEVVVREWLSMRDGRAAKVRAKEAAMSRQTWRDQDQEESCDETEAEAPPPVEEPPVTTGTPRVVATRALQEDATDGKAGKPKATGLEGHDMVIENGQVVAGGTDEQDSVGGWDAEGGYILGCLCQGRFGNQFDYMLGFLEVAKALNRTLVLPPWAEYNAKRETGKYPYFPRFTDFFQLAAVQGYHRAIDAYDFVDLYKTEWTQAGLTGFSVRPSREQFEGGGAPRTQFWEALGVSFSSYSELQGYGWQQWVDISHPVLALDCAPGSYPAPRHLDSLAEHFIWSEAVVSRADKAIGAAKGQPFVAVQYRSEFAWSDRCGSFSTSQCDELIMAQEPGLNDYREWNKLSEVCDPPLDDMRQMLVQAMELSGAKHLYVAADQPFSQLGMVGDLFKEFNAIEGGAGFDGLYIPQTDLAVLTTATVMIGHCPSSFTNIATRLRVAQGKVVAYWGLPSSLPRSLP